VGGTPAEHLRACVNWPWCIRNDAPITDTSLTRVQLEVRWKDVVSTVYVDASAIVSDVAMTTYNAVIAALEGNTVTSPPELPIILKVTSVRVLGFGGAIGR
jgi:hypothetical protein